MPARCSTVASVAAVAFNSASILCVVGVLPFLFVPWSSNSNSRPGIRDKRNQFPNLSNYLLSNSTRLSFCLAFIK